MNQYIPILFILAFAGVIIAATLFISLYFGPKRNIPVKSEPFECGNPPSGKTRERFAVKFYLVAMLFLLFDVEVAFLLPWAIMVRPLGWFGFIEMTVFLGILVLGLAYAWRRGGLKWE